ncbi:MAG: 3'(2'),5'-bisphosphate nucleotidase CysQ [Candidatus Omnitrophica bacterium]|nr:3'(2'),5'-bisphosphate nucleotidase CysQ [Candidatus Omnitrophota bacterium]
MIFNDSQIKQLLKIASLAGQKIIEVYNSHQTEVSIKKDNSPLTLADQLSQELIVKKLKKLFPKIPLISEESRPVSFSKRKNWKYFWLIDPLDGTKEFIKRNGEFTVNIALIHNSQPVLGIIGIPARQQLYFGQKQKGAFKVDKNNKFKPILANKLSGKRVVIVRSRSHQSLEEETVVSWFKNPRIIYAGSSLKFCRVAEGRADLYLRQGPTMEWDTASGQAIAESSGARVFGLTYNKKNLKNPGFICAASRKDIISKILNRSKL